MSVSAYLSFFWRWIYYILKKSGGISQFLSQISGGTFPVSVVLALVLYTSDISWPSVVRASESGELVLFCIFSFLGLLSAFSSELYFLALVKRLTLETAFEMTQNDNALLGWVLNSTRSLTHAQSGDKIGLTRYSALFMYIPWVVQSVSPPANNKSY